jgi:hypothetical protein
MAIMNSGQLYTPVKLAPQKDTTRLTSFHRKPRLATKQPTSYANVLINSASRKCRAIEEKVVANLVAIRAQYRASAGAGAKLMGPVLFASKVGREFNEIMTTTGCFRLRARAPFH